MFASLPHLHNSFTELSSKTMQILHANKYYQQAQFILSEFPSVCGSWSVLMRLCVYVCVSTRSCWPFYKLRRVWEFPSCSDLSIRVCVCVHVHFCVTLFICVCFLSVQFLCQPPDVGCCVSDHSWLILLLSLPGCCVMLVKGKAG